MNISFNSFDGYAITEAEIIEAEINGVGGAAAPQLLLPFRLSVSDAALKPREGIEIVSLSAKLVTSTGPIAHSNPIPIGFILPKGYSVFRNQHHNLEFPLDAARVAALERLRAGNDLKLRLEVVLAINKLHALNEPTAAQSRSAISWALLQPHKLHSQTEFTVPRDAWVTRVLPHVGHGIVHVVELPAAPLEAVASWSHAFKALQQAQERHKIGMYDEAVARCRVALEKFFEREDKTGNDGKTRSVPVLKRSWETKLGQATYDWLNAALGAIKQAANPTAHSPNVHYDQFESQMIITITTSLVAYAARTGEPEESK